MFEWFHETELSLPDEEWRKELVLAGNTMDGPFNMQVHHEEGSLHWHAEIELDLELTDLRFGTEMTEWFTCILQSDHYTTRSGMYNVFWNLPDFHEYYEA